ncbi:MAG: response regulator [Pseudomonadales bacterium]
MPHALIVDDSRTARAVLKHMLSKESYEVEAVESAEQGLAYLREASTDVIFMDHMMPGMDGFQAVKRLKASESLKHIPIVMYTSKEGDVYRGQANALGATSILSKPATQVQLQQVLKEVAASMVSASRADARAEQKEATVSKSNGIIKEKNVVANSSEKTVEPQTESSTEAKVVEAKIDSNAEVKTEAKTEPAFEAPKTVDEVITSSTPVTTPITKPETHTETARPDSIASNDSVSEKTPRNSSSLMPWLLIAGVLAAILAGAKYSELRSAHEHATKANTELLESVIVVANQAGRFDAGELAFSGDRVDLLRAVLEAADTAGFSGAVLLKAHVGQFCMSQSPSGELYVAGDQLAIAECVAVGMNEKAAVRQTETLSSRFRELLDVHPVLQNQSLSVLVEGLGDAEPLMPYPRVDAVEKAGDWNSVARANNRVEFQLLPDEQ